MVLPFNAAVAARCHQTHSRIGQQLQGSGDLLRAVEQALQQVAAPGIADALGIKGLFGVQVKE